MPKMLNFNLTSTAVVLSMCGFMAMSTSAQADHLSDLKMKAEEGDIDAAYNLGYEYASGYDNFDRKEIHKDNLLAIKWLTAAARKGHLNAQKYLSVAYSKGLFPQNFAVSHFWRDKCARQGDSLCQSSVGLDYSSGRGVRENHPLAYMWLSLAAANGDKSAIQFRDMEAKDLNRAELATAQHQANLCLQSEYIDCGD